jgi:hypothetical protein
MPSGAGANQDQTIDTLLGSLSRVLHIDDIVEYDAPNRY